MGSPAMVFEPGGSVTTSARPAGSDLIAAASAEKPIGDE